MMLPFNSIEKKCLHNIYSVNISVVRRLRRMTRRGGHQNANRDLVLRKVQKNLLDSISKEKPMLLSSGYAIMVLIWSRQILSWLMMMIYILTFADLENALF